jgi:Family of unknown function (DUF5706)
VEEPTPPFLKHEIDEDKLEILWKVYDDSQSAIRFADTKVGAAATLSLTLTGWTMLAVIQGNLNKADPLWPVVLMGLVVTCGTLLATLAATYATIVPRSGVSTRPRSTVPGGRAGVRLYFKEIARTSREDYVRSIRESDIDSLSDELARQVWQVATICDRKYVWVARALKGMSTNVLCALAVLLCLTAISLRADKLKEVQPAAAARPAPATR